MVEPGQRAAFAVKADGRRYRWSVRRLGRGAVARARLQRRPARSRVPVRLRRSGVAMLTVRVGHAGTRRRSPCRRRRRARVLVVLPEATWQARNRLEANGDGYPDLLPEDPR